MAISAHHSRIARLGTELAQNHYGATTDIDGVLPWKPTDADRQKLVELLGGRGPTLTEERVFEQGYGESMHRLDGNANDVRLNPVMLHELTAAFGRYGVMLPAEGTPERLDAEQLIARAITDLREQFEALLPEPPPASGRESDREVVPNALEALEDRAEASPGA